MTKHQHIGEMEMMDRVLEILSMYRLPSIFKYVFSKFIPMLMKDSKHFYYDGFLLILQTVLRKLVHIFDAPSLKYDNLYSADKQETSINTVETSLLGTVFKERHPQSGQGNYLPRLIEGSYKLNKAIDTVSPSLTFQFIYSTAIEKTNLDCLDEVISFIHKMLPVMFIKTNKIENILVLFEMILKIGYDCVRKMSLSAFCEFNLSFLECWSVLEIYVNPTSDKVSAEKMKNLKKKYIVFNLDYFSWTLSTFDCFKELNDIPNIETVLQNLKDLYFIRSRILTLSEDFSRVEKDKHRFIYGRLFPVEGYFLKPYQVCIKKYCSSFTLRHLNETIGLVAGRRGPIRLFLNVT